MIDDDMYNVDSYSEKELLDILDLFNPTDRELEAKICSYIDKYSNDYNDETVRLHTFFTNIYKRFFYVEEEEEEEEDIEGFTGMITTDTDTDKDNSGNNDQPTNTFALSYSLNGIVNPLLKQTIQRVITIDSQYRDSKNSLSTQYTFNFTEILKDVVSLKLYAVQIPYTWYTISRNYGSNFIFIKGNVPGINNGLHDISINIMPGNYSLTTINNIGNDTSKSISGAIQESIALLPSVYTDVSFGYTNLAYDINQCLATFIIDIQKHYNENAYYFHFPGILYSPVSIVKNDTFVANVNRYNNLSAFLGFNSSSYSTCSFYSTRTVTNTLNNTISNFMFDASNNYINIIQYYTDSTNGYDPDPKVSTIYQTLKITFPIIGSQISQNAIYQLVNDTIKNDNRFVDSFVNLIPIQGNDICGNTFENSGNSYFEWKFKLNRFKGNNIPQYKTVIQVPVDETPGTNPIWIGTNSCFYFKKKYNELNELLSETYVFSSNFEISGNIYYYLKCNDVKYNNKNINDFSYNLQNNYTGYSLNGYLSEINNGFNKLNRDQSSNNGNNNIFNVNTSNITVSAPSSQSVAYFNTSDSRFHMSIDMNKYLFTENFRIDISNTFLSKILAFSTSRLNINIPFEQNTIFDVSANSQISTIYSANLYPLLMIVYPDSKFDGQNSNNNGIAQDISYHVYLPQRDRGYAGYTDLANGINKAFQTFEDVSFSNPLKYMKITITPTENINEVQSILTVNVTKTLTEKDYTIYFYDNNFNDIDASYNKSSWFINLKLKDASYNLAKYNYGSYSDICGNDIMSSDSITLIDGVNNSFELIPIEEGDIGAGTLEFIIDAGTYNRINLFYEINRLFDSRPETYGTRISFITDINNYEYTKIRWNVNKIYTSQDYKLVCYDLYSFVSCFLGNSSIRNATSDTTLGYIMGFHSLTEYILTSTYLNTGYYYDISNSNFTNSIYSIDNTTYPYRTIIKLTGDTPVSVNLYNYFMVILDDYNLSHLNDGLVTIMPKDNNVSLPYYANRAKYLCDPVTKQVINTGITDVASNNLTQNQIYSINQIINTQNTPKSNKNQGVYVSDIFGLVPIKTSGYTPGQVYVEFGGTLQAHERTYFGPVNIHRMAISLLNNRGEVVDLNGADWSLQFVCEQLYQNNNVAKK